MAWIIGVDVGGTFTDFIALDDERGTVHVHKMLSTPENPARAILDGLRTLAEERGLPLAEVAHLAHGTTVGTNALIQRRGAAVALITTEGFRDLLEIGRRNFTTCRPITRHRWCRANTGSRCPSVWTPAARWSRR